MVVIAGMVRTSEVGGGKRIIERIDAEINVGKFEIGDITKLAYVSNIMSILMYRGVRKILIGEIPTRINVMGVVRKVDIYGKGTKATVYGEIERNRETLQAEVLGLRNALRELNEPSEILGFLVMLEDQSYDKDLLWEVKVRVYDYIDIPIYRIDVKRGLAWPR
jgi:hypothetical protein